MGERPRRWRWSRRGVLVLGVLVVLAAGGGVTLAMVGRSARTATGGAPHATPAPGGGQTAAPAATAAATAAGATPPPGVPTGGSIVTPPALPASTVGAGPIVTPPIRSSGTGSGCAPAVYGTNPAFAPPGHDKVTVGGCGFTDATAVMFTPTSGGATMTYSGGSILVIGDGQVVVYAVFPTPNVTYDVQVVTPSGPTRKTPSDQFQVT